MIKKLMLQNKKISKLMIFYISVICLVSFLLRLYIFPYDVPITLDGAGYFWYATDMNILNQFPTNYNYPNNGWPVFLSSFYSLSNSNDFLDYMNLQRFLSVCISIIMIPLVFLLCKKFIPTNYSLIATAIFAFEPRMLLNSVLGITEQLFVLLVSCMLLFFFQKKSYFIYASFAAAAFCAIVRYEGILLIAPLSIAFFIKYRERKSIIKYLIALAIFALIIIPTAYIRTESIGEDGLVSHVSAGAGYYQHIADSGDNGIENLIKLFEKGFKNLIIYSGWISIPIFLFFVPLGIFIGIKNRNSDIGIIFLFAITLLIPLFYAYTRDLQETRYFLSLYPIFCIFSGFGIKKILEKSNFKKKLTIIIISGIIVSSFLFIDYKKIDAKEEMNSYAIAKSITNVAEGTNDLSHITKYYSASVLSDQEYPILKEKSVILEPKIVSLNKFETIKDVMVSGKESGLTHLILDGKNKKEFLNDIFFQSQNYPYLIEYTVPDSNKSHLKIRIFEIDYEKFIENQK